MLYQNRVTGGLVEVISSHGEGILMCVDANEEVLYLNEEDLTPHLTATTEQLKNEERLTDSLKAEGAALLKPTKKETFPNDMRVNVNMASARIIADTLPGVGLKTARDIKDLQMSLPGERFTRLEQLRSIKRVDWEEIFKDNLVRVE